VDGRYFLPKDALRASAVAALSNVKIYLNHAGFLERMSGGRDVQNWVGMGGPARWDEETGTVRARVKVFNREFADDLDAMLEADALGQLEMSIHARVEWDEERDDEDGVLVAKRFLPDPVNSVDFVYAGNAGGRVERMLQAALFSDNARKNEPTKGRKNDMPMTEKETEAKLAEMSAKLAEFAEREKANAERETALAKREAAVALDAKLVAATDALGAGGAKVVRERFAGAVSTDGMDEFIALVASAMDEARKTAPAGAPAGAPNPANPNPANPANPLAAMGVAGNPPLIGLGAPAPTGGASVPAAAANARLVASYTKQFIAAGHVEVDAKRLAESAVARLLGE
jgi:hypothetical protein